MKKRKFDPCCYIPNQPCWPYNMAAIRGEQEQKRQRARILKAIDNQKIKNNGNKYRKSQKSRIRDSRNCGRGSNKTIGTPQEAFDKQREIEKQYLETVKQANK